ncbi:hypothetical protein EDB87DRAFT_1330490 [Lactarius vividus]|nr:hypothetical protein EDB87DRAFT_1330490 [Lactarius vividus]
MAPEISITDIDSLIAIFQNVLSQLPRSHSDHIFGVHTLARARFARYKLSQQKEDLDKSILHDTEAILLPPVSLDGRPINIVELLFDLAFALLLRSEKFEQSEDVKYSIVYLRGVPLDYFDLPKHTVTTLLIRALGIQVQLEARDGTRDLDEMLDLCREFLGPNISADFPVAAFMAFGEAVMCELSRGRSVQSLDKVVKCLRDAARLCPPGSKSHPVLYALALAYWTRFVGTHSNEDHEEGTVLLERILDPNQPGECQESFRNLALLLTGGFAHARSTIFENPEYTEVTIPRFRTLLNSPPRTLINSSSIDERFRLSITGILASQNRKRFRHYGLAESLEDANSYSPQLGDLSSSPNLEESGGQSDAVQDLFQGSYPMKRTTEEILHLEELLSDTPPGTPHHKGLLKELETRYRSKFCRTDDISDIEESIKYSRLSLGATHFHDQWRIIPLLSLLDTLVFAFTKTSKINYLDELIAVGYDILELDSAQLARFRTIQTIVPSLLIRGRLLGRREDRLEAIRLMSMTANDQYVQEPDRFHLSCQWAIHARRIGHPTTLTAYRTAMSLVQESLSFAPTVSIQHARLVEMGEDCQTMPLDYASFQIK